MTRVTLFQAQQRLEELLQAARAGEAVEIIQEGWTYRLTAVPPRPIRPRPPITGTPTAGRLKGQLVVPDDFDAPLEELREYME